MITSALEQGENNRSPAPRGIVHLDPWDYHPEKKIAGMITSPMSDI
jgi:hypothetical protein